MRILMRILGIIAVIVAVGMGTLGVVRNFGDAEDAKESAAMVEQAKKDLETMKENVKQLSGPEADEMNSEIADMEEMMDIASPGTYTTLGIMMALLALASIVSAVFLFKAGGKTAAMLLGATVVIGLAAIVLSPDFSSKYGAMSNRSVAIIVTVPAVLAALFAFAMRNGKKQPAHA
ncbi:hypothetical protein OGH69_04250 [Flavobacterium sp. MFBS3-15]|uniref:hypothetical protein n=1 Tax=Flavobacterium sp. MFBS3-15 TaxID=2989816 RepID=UPI002236023D|nr:hypothetical protein [Flavobacterium sp. MFBS3-15]MCW4468168.1 hypothetical protein [Flavobacterium sp. MFBS3-15]